MSSHVIGREPALVELRGVEVRYGLTVAVSGVDLTAGPGGFTALVGPSGCGKTSLLRAIAGFERPTRGTVSIDGEVLYGPECWVPPEERRVGMVFQEGALFPHLTVRDNVLYGIRRQKKAQSIADRALDLVDLRHLGDRYPDELSGGQQQRVALARALAPGPRLVLLDEPFAALDRGLREQVRDEMRAILDGLNISVFLVTHDQEEALSCSDRVVVMSRGRVLQEGPAEEIYRRPVSLEVARFFGDGRLLPCTVAAGVCTSVFGSAACDAEDGEARLFLRPEEIELAPRGDDDGTDGTRGRIVRRRFFGHDALDEVALEAGGLVEVRVLSSTTLPVGEAVRLRLRSSRACVFPPD